MLATFALLTQQFQVPQGYTRQTEIGYTGSSPKNYSFESYTMQGPESKPGNFQKIYVVLHDQGDKHLEVPLPADATTGEMNFSFVEFAASPNEKAFMLERKVATGTYETYLYTKSDTEVKSAPDAKQVQSLNDFIVKKIGHPGKPDDHEGTLTTVFPKRWTKAGLASVDVTDDDTRHDPHWFRVTINPETGAVTAYKATTRKVGG